MDIVKIVVLVILVISSIIGVAAACGIVYSKTMLEVIKLRKEIEEYKRGIGIYLDTEISEKLNWYHKEIGNIKEELEEDNNKIKWYSSYDEARKARKARKLDALLKEANNKIRDLYESQGYLTAGQAGNILKAVLGMDNDFYNIDFK